MHYSEETVEQVRNANPILDVVGSYVKLTKKGNAYFGLCPFHNEKTPSFSVTPDRGMYHCYGCGASGNVISFVMQYENLSFPDALKMLADRGGVPLPAEDDSAEERERQSRRMKLLAVQKEAATYYYRMLRSPAGKRGMEYLKQRGLSQETMQSFGLGFAPVTSDGLYRHLRQMGYDDELLKDSGLVKIEERGTKDRFWNRVIFPIMDNAGRVIGLGGRVMGDGEPKYLNSPETPIFDKSRNLYGLNVARRSKKPYFLVCEGYMDVISLHQAGFTNAVASLGTAFTSEHGLILKRLRGEVILTYDADEAGRKAAMRAIPILREAGLAIRVLTCEPAKDPDEFIRTYGAEEFQKRIDQARNAFLFEIDEVSRTYELQDPAEMTAFENEIADRLLVFTEEVERNNYLEAVAREFHIPAENLRKLVRNRSGRQKKPAYTPEHAARMPERKTEEQKKREAFLVPERMLLSWMAREPGIIGEVKKVLTEEDFTEGPTREIAEKLFSESGNGAALAAKILNAFLDSDDYEEAAEILSDNQSEALSESAKEQALRENVVRIKRNALEVKSRSLSDVAELQKVMEEQEKLNHLQISYPAKKEKGIS